MSKKRRQDIWNERAEDQNRMFRNEAKQFVNNIAANTEGISAEFEKYPINTTTTPKLFDSNKTRGGIHKGE